MTPLCGVVVEIELGRRGENRWARAQVVSVAYVGTKT